MDKGRIILAIILDFIFKDPVYRLHPVRIIGYYASWLESIFVEGGKRSVFWGGVFYILHVFLLVPVILLLKIPIFGPVFEIFLAYSLLSTGSLLDEVLKIYVLIKKGKIKKARKDLSYLVTRDTDYMNEKELTLTTLETLSENLVDAIISPLFYLFLGGVPLLLLYKITNTLDSMVGYKRGYYTTFGRVSARMDDIMNYIPSRIAAFLLYISGLLMKYPMGDFFKILWKERGKTESPNSWLVEGGTAIVLGVTIGGPVFYHGEKIERPTMGKGRRDFHPSIIIEGEILIGLTGIIFIILALLL